MLLHSRYLEGDRENWDVPLPEPGFANNTGMKCPRIVQTKVRICMRLCLREGSCFVLLPHLPLPLGIMVVCAHI